MTDHPPVDMLWQTPDGKRYRAQAALSDLDMAICDQRTTQHGEGFCARGEQLEKLEAAIKEFNQKLEAGRRYVDECKLSVDQDLSRVHGIVEGMGEDLKKVQGDLHTVGLSVVRIESSMDKIAVSLAKMADFPEVWSNFKGFLAVIGFLRKYALVIAAVVVFTLWSLGYGLPGAPSKGP